MFCHKNYFLKSINMNNKWREIIRCARCSDVRNFLGKHIQSYLKLLSKDYIPYWTSYWTCFEDKSCEFESRSLRGVLDTTLYNKVCQWLATGWWFSSGTPVSSTNKTDRHDIAEIMLKVALNTNKTKPNRLWLKTLNRNPCFIRPPIMQ